MERQTNVKIVLGSYDERPHPYHEKYLGDVSEWVISDINPRFPSIEKIDARSIPYRDVSALYASHILEHIAQSQVLDTLKHWNNVLQSGGWLHVNVPDIEFGLDLLMKLNNGETITNPYFNTRERVNQIINGTMESEFDTHKSWWTEEKLRMHLVAAGFVNIRVWKEYEAHDMVCILGKAYKK